MRLALLLLVSLTATAAPRFERFCGRTAQGRSDRGFACDDGAFFEAFPANGAGTTTACSTTAPTGARGEALAYSRADVAECYSNDGQTLTQLAANQPRVSSGRIDSTWMGIWSEGVSRNYLLHSRDWSNAAHTKTNMTCARNAPGMRGGDINGATTCTATANNAKVVQCDVRGSFPYIMTTHIKRGVGAGVVSVSPDDVSYYPVAARLSSTRWRRVVPSETAGCAGGDCIVVPEMRKTMANPCLAIQIATSGDSVILDFGTIEETLAWTASSPVENAGSSNARNADIIGRSLPAGVFSANNVSMAATIVGSMGRTGSHAAYARVDATAFQTAGINTGASSTTGSALCQQASTVGGFLTSHNGLTFGSRVSCDFTAVGPVGVSGATVMKNNATVSGTFTATLATFNIGSTGVSNSNAEGVVKGVCFGTAGQCPSQTPTTTSSDFVWVGDSLIAGIMAGAYSPPSALSSMTGRTIWNAGVSVAQISTDNGSANSCTTNLTAHAGLGLGGVIWTCGTNDLNSGSTAAALATAAQVPLAAARARGEDVVIVGILPRGSSSGWNGTLETKRTDFNALMQTWAGLNGASFVSSESMGDGASPNVLLAANNSGDGLHLTPAGGVALATLVDAVVP